jgi:hypothetical protein
VWCGDLRPDGAATAEIRHCGCKDTNGVFRPRVERGLWLVINTLVKGIIWGKHDGMIRTTPPEL